MSDNSYTNTTSSSIAGAEDIPKVETNMPEDTSLKARLAQASRPPVNYNLDAGVQFKSAAGITDKTVTGRDANKYIGYADYLENLNTRDAQAARSQSAGQKVAYGLYQGIVGEVIGGSLQGLGSLAMGASSEENTLFALGRAISEKTRENSNIFTQEPGKAFALNDVGWWASNIPSLLSTLSMFVPGMAVGKGASLVGRAGMVARRARDVAKLKKAASSAEVAQKAIRATAGKAAQAATQVEKGASTVLTAVGMRHAENIREAVDVAKQAENEFLQSQTDTFEMLGTTAFRQFVADTGRQPTSKYELAKYVGAAAAKTSYRVNSANIVFDLTQTAMIFKPFKAVTRGATSTGLEATKAAAKLGKKAGKGITDAAAASTRGSRFLDRLAPFKELGLGMASEGAEEAVNFIGSAEGLAYAEELRDIDRGTFGERLNGYLADDHLWEGAFWGALGGGVFQAVGGAFGKKQNALLRAQEEQIKTQEYYAGEIKKAEESGDVRKAETLKSQMITTLALKAAQTGRVDALIDMLNDDSYLDELSKSGMGTLDEILAKKDSLVSQVEQVEARYKEAIEWATSNGMDSFSKGAYLNDSLRAHSIIAQADTMLEKLEATKELGSEEEILAARLLLLEEIKELSEEERAFYHPTVLEIMEEKAAFEKQKGRGVLPALTESLTSGLNNDLRTRVTLEATRAASERQISKMRSQDAVTDYMDRGEKMQKEEVAKYKKRVKEEIKKETNETRLNDMLKTAKRTKNEEIQTLVESRLKELAKIKAAKTAADNPEKTVEEEAKEDEVRADRDDDASVDNSDNQLSFDFDENTGDENTNSDELDVSDENKTGDLNLDQPTPLDTKEELAPLLERLLDENKVSRDEAEDSQKAAIAVYNGHIKIRSKDIARITAKRNRLKKKDDAVSQSKAAAYDTILEFMKDERSRLRADLKQVKDLHLPATQEFEPGRDIDPEVAAEMQLTSDQQGGPTIFVTDLLGEFVKNMTQQAPNVFENGFAEWRLKADGSELVLNATTSITYAAIQSLLNGAPARIEKVDRSDFAEPEDQQVEIVVSGQLKDITAFPVPAKSKDKTTTLTFDSEGYPIVHYAIIVEHKGEDVIVGYLPQVVTLAKHAQRTNIYMKGGEYPGGSMDLAYMAMHSNSFTAIAAIDRLIRLRRQLAENGDQPLPFKLHTESQFGKKPQRGSLLRPGAKSDLKIEELDGVEAAIEEYGFAYMGADNNTNVLRSFNNNLTIPNAQPYQDGLVLNKPGEMDYGKGQLYMPVPVPNSLTKEIIWVRVPKVSVSRIW